MKLNFFSFTAVLASVAASPTPSTSSVVATDSGFHSVNSPRTPIGPNDVIYHPDSVTPKKDFTQDEQELACLKKCPAVIPGLHPYKQPLTFLCRLRCGADAYRRASQGTEGKPGQKGRGEESLASESHEIGARDELYTLPLKKHLFWNVTDNEGQSEQHLAAVAVLAGGGENDRIIPGLPMGNPCAWPPQLDNSWPSQRELYLCLEACPAGSFLGVCLHPCFLGITERRCREKRVTEAKPKDGEYSAAESALAVVEGSSESSRPSDSCSERQHYKDYWFVRCESNCSFYNTYNFVCEKACVTHAILRCRARKEAAT
ncbi:uncharacterized protein ColSpa_10979 [Colletotrichum spaethianum]|uniref:Uncharacterized protein n=1 Tax=Colletotrichum spaethianum TaxID=700344 RepID=A0AA37PEG5_9PEZI|nr:uncharacterized protein ColSpa_10979 [Colletotrichum spaethianum]GKT50798.1 hypothetical protein ColSpa_10979 [Colletotrichum spaethianum]